MSEQHLALSLEEQEQLKRVQRSEKQIKKARLKKNLSNPSWVFWSGFKYLTLAVAALAVLVPPYSVLMASFKTLDEYYNTSKVGLPESFANLSNYIKVFTDGNLGLAFMNTGTILLISLFFTIIFGTQVAYVLSRFEFRGKKLVLLAYIIAMVIPAVTTQVATFEVIKSLGFINNKASVILLYIGADVVMIYVFLQFMKGIPEELDEAAKMEGASYFLIYRKIILPLLKPAIATIVILRTIFIYNDFYFPLLYLPDASQVTVSTALYKFTSVFGTEWTTISAGIVIILIPSIVIFLSLQKQIYAGVTNGAVKG
ncbi:sugar ABC transporter permease [Vibrio natriegens]|uniref:carbohydrate ABC transporter permease n=1 Tax=Vibrio TaxID=662 RepID=UPI0008042798|nr:MULTISPECIES: carbohydrate ABC transporter permease [Vibrio harveyi group]CAH0531745.1 Melibiose/raffinose/stachyose import permease protein MelC [Catenococcus thiocycli]ANQ24667.1 sugar ABC transporter permease [Vibrio natriegens]EGQ7684373.1 carbohydrate ABC transporter permease [Vibrio parahaemolyticus]EGQ8182961.1 carbohydrate ABC transporter permease [Vibrio parahaemolyticus]EGQ8545768.1 ABC transporter permease subunit [Vibrio parahaemolyticus]